MGWNREEQAREFARHFVPADVSIIQIDGEDAGYFKVEERRDRVHLAGIYLSARHRGRGAGTEVLKDLLAWCGARSKPLRLRVLRPNPSQRLYRRLGFRVVDATQSHVTLEAGSSAV